MNVINGSAITAEKINNVRDIFDLARNTTGTARIELLGVAHSVSLELTHWIEKHIEAEKAKA